MFKKSEEVKKIIQSLEGEQAVMAIHEILQPVFDENRNKLSECERNFCLVEVLECEINSGGFDSFFRYDYGDLAMDTFSALKDIGSVTFLTIFEKAISMFPKSRPHKSADDREEFIDDNEDTIYEIWNALDNEFYKYEENIHELLLEYVKKNIDGFR